MKYRYAERGDLSALARLHVATWQAASRGMILDEFLDAVDESHALQRLDSVIDVLPRQVGVVEIDDDVVGFCRFGPSKESDVPPATTELFALNVEPGHWRRGVGRLLTEQVLSELKSRGAGACTLWVLTDNARARRFYEALGFFEDGATRTEAADTEHPLHELRYCRPLR